MNPAPDYHAHEALRPGTAQVIPVVKMMLNKIVDQIYAESQKLADATPLRNK